MVLNHVKSLRLCKYLLTYLFSFLLVLTYKSSIAQDFLFLSKSYLVEKKWHEFVENKNVITYKNLSNSNNSELFFLDKENNIKGYSLIGSYHKSVIDKIISDNNLFMFTQTPPENYKMKWINKERTLEAKLTEPIQNMDGYYYIIYTIFKMPFNN